jgi:hypothetical protein
MTLPHVPQEMPCLSCGSLAEVVRTRSRFGEQVVLIRAEGVFYINITCPNCGPVQQEFKWDVRGAGQ